MTPDEMDKKIEFILQMQAQFEANMSQSEANTNNLRVSVADLAAVVRDSIKISDDRFTRLDDRLSKLTDAQKATDERLNVLISVVEKHITGPDRVSRS
jgi:hypothetical protein